MAGAHLDSVQAGPGHQRQRLRFGGDPRDGASMLAKVKPGEHAPVRLVGRARRRASSDRPAYVDELAPGRARPDRPVPQLRHGRLAELRLHRLRRGRVELRRAGAPSRPARSRSRTSTSRTTRSSASPYDDTEFSGEATTRRSSLGRHPVRRPLHGRRGDQDGRGRQRSGAASAGAAVRPVLPPGLRHVRRTYNATTRSRSTATSSRSRS